MHTIFAFNADLSQKSLSVDDETELHHVRHVLKMKTGESVEIINGQSERAEGVIQRLTSSVLELDIRRHEILPPPAHIVILVCAIPKKSKFETIVEKATELGVTEIIPLVTDNSDVRPPKEKLERMKARYHSVAINAAKQSKRATIPRIHAPQSLMSAFQQIESKTFRVIPSLQKETVPILTLSSQIANSSKIAIFIGPEGDFSEKEYQLAKKEGCLAVTLGKTILKVETAALTALAAVEQILLQHES